MGRTVREAMTSRVVSVHPDAPYKQIVQVLAEHGFDAVPVVDETGALLGVVSGADLTCHEEEPPSLAHLVVGGREARSHARKSRGRTARELMTAPARTIGPDDEVCDALREMTRARVGRLVVVADDQVVGMLARSDLLRVFLRSDEDLQREVETAVRPVVGSGEVHVIVADGIAHLRGRVELTTTAWAAAAAARDVPGIVDVEDCLVGEIDDTLVHELSMRGPFG